jgi:hypothetical protein
MPTAFGIDIDSPAPPKLLAPADALPTGRRMRLELAPIAGEPPRWPTGGRAICVRRDRAGVELFTIEEHASAGYRIWGRGRGEYLLSADASHLLCAPDGASEPQWERFLVGQVLPFAALLSGLEIFHASAVALGGRAIAFAGPSGAGKTSLALALCRLGAGFLADDVIALEIASSSSAQDVQLLAHPGTPVAGVDRREDERLRLIGAALPAAGLGGDARERLLPMRGERAPVPLAALFFLDRCRDESRTELSFEPVCGAPLLLAATFNFALDSPKRMRGLLDVCALAARGRVERVVIPSSVDPGELAEAVRGRVEGEL